MKEWLEQLPELASPLSEYHIGISRKKESEEDYFGALTHIVKAKDEDHGNNRNYYLKEILRLNDILNKNDQIVKNEIAQLYKLKAIVDEQPDLYVSASDTAEKLVKRLKNKEQEAFDAVRGMMDELNIHMQKTENFMEDILEGRPVRNLNDEEPEKVTEQPEPESEITEPEQAVVTGENVIQERKADIEKIVEAIYQNEKEQMESYLNEEEEMGLFFPTMFPEQYYHQFNDCLKEGRLDEMSGIILKALDEDKKTYGEMISSLVDVAAEVYGNTIDTWFLDKAYEYLEEAHDNKVITEKNYKKKLKNLNKAAGA